MMTCDEYREAVTADPSYDGGGEHLASCSECQAYRAEMQAFDRQIAAALNVNVPELRMPELPEVDTSKVTTLADRRIGVPGWLAMAATVAFAAVIGFRMFSTDIPGEPLAEQIIAHLDHEPYALRVTDKPVSDRRLARVMPASVATLDHSAGLITYAQTCVINGTEVPHLVIQGERGPVTILLMPEQSVDGAQSLSGESINGILLPVGDGSIAIIGEEGENLQRIEEKVVDSVAWST